MNTYLDDITFATQPIGLAIPTSHGAASVSAASAGTQAAGTAISADVALTQVSTAGANYSVTFPAAATGKFVRLMNLSTTEVVRVFPESGGAIDGLATNAAYQLAPLERMESVRISSTLWKTLRRGIRPTRKTVSNLSVVDGSSYGTGDFGNSSFTKDNTYRDHNWTSILPARAAGMPVYMAHRVIFKSTGFRYADHIPDTASGTAFVNGRFYVSRIRSPNSRTMALNTLCFMFMPADRITKYRVSGAGGVPSVTHHCISYYTKA